jgi:hypothetical protein
LTFSFAHLTKLISSRNSQDPTKFDLSKSILVLFDKLIPSDIVKFGVLVLYIKRRSEDQKKLPIFESFALIALGR